MEPKTWKLLINFITNNNALHKSNPIMLKLVSQVNFVFRFQCSFDIIGSLICMSHNLSQVYKRTHVLLSKIMIAQNALRVSYPCYIFIFVYMFLLD